MCKKSVILILVCLLFSIGPATAAAPNITFITPQDAGNEANITLTLHGSGFEPGAEILLTPVTLRPELLSTMDGNNEERFLVQPMDLVVTNDYLYLFDLGDTFTIVNVSDPHNPVRTGTISLRTKGFVVAVKGHYAYVTGGNALEILDISDPANPVPAGYVSNEKGGTILREGFGIGVSNNHVFIPSVLTDSLEIFDVTDPKKPVFRARIANRDFGSMINNPNNIFVSGNYAYLTSAASNAFEIIDITNPRMPDHRGYLANGENGALLTIPSSVYVKGRYAYVTSSGDNALEIIDAANPENPVHTASLKNGETGAWLSGPYGVKVSGNYLFVGTDNTLEIIDITDPAHPHHKFSTNDGSSLYVKGPREAFDIKGRYAYVTRSKVPDGYNMTDLDPKNMLDIFDIGFIPVTHVTVPGPGSAEGQVDLIGGVPGKYNVVITNPDGQMGVLPEGFEIPARTGQEPSAVTTTYPVQEPVALDTLLPVMEPSITAPSEEEVLPYVVVIMIVVIAVLLWRIFRK